MLFGYIGVMCSERILRGGKRPEGMGICLVVCICVVVDVVFLE